MAAGWRALEPLFLSYFHGRGTKMSRHLTLRPMVTVQSAVADEGSDGEGSGSIGGLEAAKGQRRRRRKCRLCCTDTTY